MKLDPHDIFNTFKDFILKFLKSPLSDNLSQCCVGVSRLNCLAKKTGEKKNTSLDNLR